jgi:hypothetical protein
MTPGWEKVHDVLLGGTEKQLIRQPVIEPSGPLRQGLSGLTGSSVPGDGRGGALLDLAALRPRALKVAQPAAAA